MEKITFSIPSISCEHCVMTIKRELEEIQGIIEVEGNATTKNITVQWDSPVTVEKIKAILKDINYPAAD